MSITDSYRLDLKQRKLVKLTAVVCVLAYTSAVLVMLFHCRPMYKNWQVYPYPGGEYSDSKLDLLRLLTIRRFLRLEYTELLCPRRHEHQVRTFWRKDNTEADEYSTDIFIVAIPLPLLRKVQMPCHRFVSS